MPSAATGMSIIVVGIVATLFCAPLFAGSVNVTVRDPGGALVGDAAVRMTAAGVVRTKPTGGDGRVTFDQLPTGVYNASVTKPGFAAWEGRVTVGDQPIDLPVSLKLAAVSTSVNASEPRSSLANSDPNYQTLRTGKLRGVYGVSNLTMTRDAGSFTFRSGSFSFLPPVEGRVTTGVFVGDGNFRMKPAGGLDAVRLKRMMGSDAVDEDFTAIVVYFSDSTFDEIKAHSQSLDESPVKHEEALKRVRDVIRTRIHIVQSDLQRMLNYEDIPNYDAEMLAEAYNGEHPGSFRAFLHGKKYPDLRFQINPHGAMPMLQAPEEVVLLNFDANSNTDGVWYLAHTEPKGDSPLTSGKEEKRLIAADHYRMNVQIGSMDQDGELHDVVVTCDLSLQAVTDGIRMAKFELFPDAQVSRVIWNGSEIPFVQESPNHDGTFYLQMPEAMTKGRVYNLTFEYRPEEMGRIWYPTPAGQASRATYDLTFRSPRGVTIVAVGKLARQSREGSWEVSQWISAVPIERAAFRALPNPALKTEVEETTKSRMSLYLALSARGFSPPSADYMLGDVGNAVRLFHSWFGKPAIDDITIVVQTGRASESLAGLVCVPPVLMLGGGAVGSRIGVSLPTVMRTGLDEAFPRLLAGQWWGNMLTPASFHDAWLAVGLANFSSSVYDLAAGNHDFKDRWEDAREYVLSKPFPCPRKGICLVRPNDAGPVWRGLLNDTPLKPGASGVLNAWKGAYVAHMLRSMMWDPQTLDRDFQAMMRDFIARFANQAVSTGDFQSVVDAHMKPVMDLDGNHRMDWFFNEWIYGTDVPSYRLEYSFTPDGKGGVLLAGKLTQSGVSPPFRMLVPIYGESAGKTWRLYVAAMRGNSTSDFTVSLSARPKQILLNMNHDVLVEKSEVSLAKQPVR